MHEFDWNLNFRRQ